MEGKVSHPFHRLFLFSEDETDLCLRRKAFTRLYLRHAVWTEANRQLHSSLLKIKMETSGHIHAPAAQFPVTTG